MASLYANENFPLKVVLALRVLGHDVLTSLEAGKANQRVSDEDVLAYAVETNRALLTINRRDFVRLHHAGIIACTQDEDIQRQAERIHQAILEEVQLIGKLVRINRPTRNLS